MDKGGKANLNGVQKGAHWHYEIISLDQSIGSSRRKMLSLGKMDFVKGV